MNLQSILAPAGPQAARIAELWWLMLGVCTAVYVLVMIVLLWGSFRRRSQAELTGISAAVPPAKDSERLLAGSRR
jgi:heme/copper-type cytochrome/quinol oxidase subunit 2